MRNRCHQRLPRLCRERCEAAHFVKDCTQAQLGVEDVVVASIDPASLEVGSLHRAATYQAAEGVRSSTSAGVRGVEAAEAECAQRRHSSRRSQHYKGAQIHHRLHWLLGVEDKAVNRCGGLDGRLERDSKPRAAPQRVRRLELDEASLDTWGQVGRVNCATSAALRGGHHRQGSTQDCDRAVPQIECTHLGRRPAPWAAARTAPLRP